MAYMDPMGYQTASKWSENLWKYFSILAVKYRGERDNSWLKWGFPKMGVPQDGWFFS